MTNAHIKHSTNAQYIFVFLVSTIYISLSKIVGVITVDPLNRANNPKIAICYFSSISYSVI